MEEEIRGTLTLASGQTSARINVSTDAACLTEGFRPGEDVTASGAYAIL